MGLTRTGIALDTDLLKRFDSYIRAEGYENRSEAFRDLIRDRLNQAGLQSESSFVVGTITLIYDHHSRLLPDKLMELQHEYHELIIATVHSHLDHDMCLESCSGPRGIEIGKGIGGPPDRHKGGAARKTRDEFSCGIPDQAGQSPSQERRSPPPPSAQLGSSRAIGFRLF